MVRKVVVGATALMLLASAYAYAQQPPGGRDGGRRWQPRAEDRAAFLDARLAALHAGLKLTPDQNSLWDAFENSVRGASKARMDDMRQMMEKGEHMSPSDRMESMSGHMARRAGEHQGASQREPRPRTDGAVHAWHRSLFRGRRQAGRPRADGLETCGRRGPVRPDPA